MSEPMSAVEIEDVLSSIRRLVSEELHPLKRPVREAVVQDDKLVLTAALRVVSEPSSEPSQDRASLVGRLAGAMAPGSSFEAETGDPEPSALAMAPVWAADETDDSASMIIDAEPDEARLETFVFHSRMADASLAPEDLASPVLDGEILDPENGILQVSDAAWAQEDATEDSFVDADAAPADIAEQSAFDNTLAFSPIEDPVWADQAEAEVMASLSMDSLAEDKPQDPPAQTAAPEATSPQAAHPKMASSEPDDEVENSLFSNDMHFDEAVLRDLVRDLIREELQGSLGERITRNVRKLVKAEVARALAIHDLE